jgi:hypothetical protein
MVNYDTLTQSRDKVRIFPQFGIPSGSHEGYLIYGEGSSNVEGYGYVNNELDTLKKRIDRLEEQRSLCSVKIYGLNSHKYNLKCPIDVVLTIFHDEVLASIPDLEIYGEGVNEIEAVNDLEDELIDLFEYLNNIPIKNLGKIPKKWLKIINFFIEKRNGN